MWCDSASYRSITGAIISNIIWFILQIFLYTRAQPFVPVRAVQTVSVKGPFAGGRTCRLCFLASRPGSPGQPRAVALEPVIQNQSESISHDLVLK